MRECHERAAAMRRRRAWRVTAIRERVTAMRCEASRERRKRRRKSRFTNHYSFPVFVFSTLFLHSVFRPFTACQQTSAQANISLRMTRRDYSPMSNRLHYTTNLFACVEFFGIGLVGTRLTPGRDASPTRPQYGRGAICFSLALLPQLSYAPDFFHSCGSRRSGHAGGVPLPTNPSGRGASPTRPPAAR